MTVIENIILASTHVLKRDKVESVEKATELLERIGMADKANSYPDRLSGGQQQRVAIVRSLMTDPELLLLDEITSALDPMLVGEVLEMVMELKQQGTTILMATHEMSFAHQAADRIVLLRDGHIIEDGTRAKLWRNPRTRKHRSSLATLETSKTHDPFRSRFARFSRFTLIPQEPSR